MSRDEVAKKIGIEESEVTCRNCGKGTPFKDYVVCGKWSDAIETNTFCYYFERRKDESSTTLR